MNRLRALFCAGESKPTVRTTVFRLIRRIGLFSVSFIRFDASASFSVQ